MNDNSEDFQLLRRFVDAGSQEAFSTLVDRYLNFVYSICLREVGDPTLAEDVTQAVFLILSRKAASLRTGTVLAGWLFKTARFTAKNAMRQEARRQSAQREVMEEMAQRANQEDAWQAITPLLHEGIDTLGNKEREAVLLRYFEGKSYAEVGTALGLSEDAARLRSSRAIEKLKLHLKKHGVAVPSAVFAALLTERAVQAAPPTCAAAVARVAEGVAGASMSTAAVGITGTKAYAISKGALQAMSTITKVKVAAVVIGLSLVGGGSTLLAVHQKKINDSHAEETLALTSWYRHDFLEAARHQREVVRLRPNDRMQKMTLGVYLRRAGEDDEGEKIYRELAQQNDNVGQRAKKILEKIGPSPWPPATAVITGRAVYEDGRPAVGISVQAWIQRKSYWYIEKRILGKRSGASTPRLSKIMNTTQVTTGVDGTYRIGGLTSAAYNIISYESGEYVARAVEEVRAKENQTVVAPDMVLQKSGKIAGRVVDKATGQPIEGVNIVCSGPRKPFSSDGFGDTDQTDAQGQYSVELAPGRNYCYISGPAIDVKLTAFSMTPQQRITREKYRHDDWTKKYVYAVVNGKALYAINDWAEVVVGAGRPQPATARAQGLTAVEVKSGQTARLSFRLQKLSFKPGKFPDIRYAENAPNRTLRP